MKFFTPFTGAVVSTIGVVTLLTAGLVVNHETSKTQISTTIQSVTVFKKLSVSSEKIISEEQLQLEELQQVVKNKETLIALRPKAIEAISAFKLELVNTENKVDAVEEKTAVLAAQDVIVNAKTGQEIETATATIVQAKDTLAQKIAAYEEEKQRQEINNRPRQTTNNDRGNSGSSPGANNNGGGSSGGSWFDDARNILNNVGGGHIELRRENGECSGALACAGRGVIYVTSSFAGFSYGKKVWAMTHELAHQYHFQNWDAIMNSPTYYSLFNGDIEKLANCMSTARGATAWGGSCSFEQINWASQIWNGVVN